MVIRNINLETVWDHKPSPGKNEKPEIAFAGKSNVGKSSLINALMNRKSAPYFGDSGKNTDDQFLQYQ